MNKTCVMILLLTNLVAACGGSGGSGNANVVPGSSKVIASSKQASSTPNSAAATSSSTSAQSSSQPSSTNSATQLKIVGYAPSWSTSADEIQYDKLTHINYAFVLPNTDGSLQSLPSPSLLQDIVSRAHANGVKVVVSVGGWNDGDDSGFVALAKTTEGRNRFTLAVVDLVNTYQLDGIDIDWEYPNPGEEAENFRLLMAQLAEAMHADNKLLTAAVIASGNTGNGILSEVFSYVDFLNLMAYDKSSGDHSPYSYAETSIAYWSARGLPKDKLVLGVPYYARPSWAAYKTKVQQNPANVCRNTDGTDYWNGIPTIRQKAQLARAYGGLMNWDLSQDTTGTNSLLTAMWESLYGHAESFKCE
jgi:chitinase